MGPSTVLVHSTDSGKNRRLTALPDFLQGLCEGQMGERDNRQLRGLDLRKGPHARNTENRVQSKAEENFHAPSISLDPLGRKGRVFGLGRMKIFSSNLLKKK